MESSENNEENKYVGDTVAEANKEYGELFRLLEEAYYLDFDEPSSNSSEVSSENDFYEPPPPIHPFSETAPAVSSALDNGKLASNSMAANTDARDYSASTSQSHFDEKNSSDSNKQVKRKRAENRNKRHKNDDKENSTGNANVASSSKIGTGNASEDAKIKSDIEDGIKDTDCHCKRKCFNKLTIPQRESLYEEFAKLPNTKRKDYYLRTITKRKPESVGSKFDESKQYIRDKYEYCFDIGGEQMEVCRNMYLKTIHVKTDALYDSLKRYRCQLRQKEMERKRESF